MKGIVEGEFVEAIDFGWDTFDEDAKLQKRVIKRNNGHTEMMGILALMVHEKVGVSLLPNLVLLALYVAATSNVVIGVC